MMSTPDCDTPVETTLEPQHAESFGMWFAHTRESRGITLPTIAHRTGIDVALIQAIEADQGEALGAPVFIRGYLSRCARVLNVRESEMWTRYQEQVTTHVAPPPLQVVHPRPPQKPLVRDLRGVIYTVAVIGVSWILIQNLAGFTPHQISVWWTDNPFEKGLIAATQPTAATTNTRYPFPSNPSPQKVTPPVVPAPRTEPVVTVKNPPPSVMIAADPVAASAVSAKVGHHDVNTNGTRANARLMLHLSEDCWVEVKDAQGKVLANSLMKANTKHGMEGAAPFTVMLGNAPAARIAVDDRLVDTAVYVPRRGTVSRFTLNPLP